MQINKNFLPLSHNFHVNFLLLFIFTHLIILLIIKLKNLGTSVKTTSTVSRNITSIKTSKNFFY